MPGQAGHDGNAGHDDNSVIKKMPGQAGHDGKGGTVTPGVTVEVLGAKAGLKSFADFLEELE